MKTITYRVCSSVFELFPDFCRGVVLARNINNMAPALGLTQLRQAEAEMSRVSLDSLGARPNITAWRKAFADAGINASQFRPAHEALARRAIQGKPLPDINTLVNFGNAFSLSKLCPVGVHPLEGVISGLELRFSRPGDKFIPFGSEIAEEPSFREIVLADGAEILTRRWVWRQSAGSATRNTSRNAVINVDALLPMSEAEVKNTCSEIQSAVTQSCGGTTEIHILNSENPSFQFCL